MTDGVMVAERTGLPIKGFVKEKTPFHAKDPNPFSLDAEWGMRDAFKFLSFYELHP